MKKGEGRIQGIGDSKCNNICPQAPINHIMFRLCLYKFISIIWVGDKYYNIGSITIYLNSLRLREANEISYKK